MSKEAAKEPKKPHGSSRTESLSKMAAQQVLAKDDHIKKLIQRCMDRVAGMKKKT